MRETAHFVLHFPGKKFVFLKFTLVSVTHQGGVSLSFQYIIVVRCRMNRLVVQLKRRAKLFTRLSYLWGLSPEAYSQ